MVVEEVGAQSSTYCTKFMDWRLASIKPRCNVQSKPESLFNSTTREPLNDLNCNAHKGAFTQASIPMPIRTPSHIVDGVDKIERVPSLG